MKSEGQIPGTPFKTFILKYFKRKNRDPEQNLTCTSDNEGWGEKLDIPSTSSYLPQIPSEKCHFTRIKITSLNVLASGRFSCRLRNRLADTFIYKYIYAYMYRNIYQTHLYIYICIYIYGSTYFIFQHQHISPCWFHYLSGDIIWQKNCLKGFYCLREA